MGRNAHGSALDRAGARHSFGRSPDAQGCSVARRSPPKTARHLDDGQKEYMFSKLCELASAQHKGPQASRRPVSPRSAPPRGRGRPQCLFAILRPCLLRLVLLETCPCGSLRLLLAVEQRNCVNRRCTQSGDLHVDPVGIFGGPWDRYLELVRATMTVLPRKGRLVDLASCQLAKTEQRPQTGKLARIPPARKVVRSPRLRLPDCLVCAAPRRLRCHRAVRLLPAYGRTRERKAALQPAKA